MNNLGIRLKKLRKERNIRQIDLAQALGLAQTTIANYEQNIRFPNEEILKKLSDYFNVSYDYLLGRNDTIYQSIPTLANDKIQIHNQDASLVDLYNHYLKHLLDGDKQLAIDLIINSAKRDIKIPDVYLSILEPALKEVGRLWEIGAINVADEHYCSIVTQHIMSLLNDYFRISKKSNLSMLSFSAGGEQHTIGIRMVTDFFEIEGWDTYLLGSNTPTESILDFIKKHNIDLVAISCTMDYHINAVENIIKTIRLCDYIKPIIIIVGGQGFHHDPLLWRKIGADGVANSALEAIIQGNNLINNNIYYKK